MKYLGNAKESQETWPWTEKYQIMSKTKTWKGWLTFNVIKSVQLLEV